MDVYQRLHMACRYGGRSRGFIAIYRSRFETVEKEEKTAQTSILLELPSFINKNILLLNGGLVLTDAFERIVTNIRKTGEAGTIFMKGLNENILIQNKYSR